MELPPSSLDTFTFVSCQQCLGSNMYYSPDLCAFSCTICGDEQDPASATQHVHLDTGKLRHFLAQLPFFRAAPLLQQYLDRVQPPPHTFTLEELHRDLCDPTKSMHQCLLFTL